MLEDRVHGQSQHEGIRDLAFPYHGHGPARGLQPIDRTTVPRDVRIELGLPERRGGLGQGDATTSRMAMPEAAMDEDGQSHSGHYDVGGSGKAADLRAISHAGKPQGLTECDLGSRVAAAYAGHDLRSVHRAA